MSQAMLDWPTPKSVRALRRFLSLASYYRRFIRGFGELAGPLTRLLKWGSFAWSPEADHAFASLCQVITATPTLQLLNFTTPFIVECDASGSGFGAVLHQGTGPVAFSSQPASCRHLRGAMGGGQRSAHIRWQGLSSSRLVVALLWWLVLTPLAMKEFRKHYTDSRPTFIHLVCVPLFKSILLAVLLARGINPSICTQPVFFRHCTYLLMFGLTSPWISSKACPKYMADH